MICGAPGDWRGAGAGGADAVGVTWSMRAGIRRVERQCTTGSGDGRFSPPGGEFLAYRMFDQERYEGPHATAVEAVIDLLHRGADLLDRCVWESVRQAPRP